MTNILSLFRRKTTYIYTTILTVIITVIIMFYSFYNYYNEVVNNHYAKNGYAFIISHNDYIKELEQYSDIISIQDGILFKPNFEDKFMGLTPSVINGEEQDESGEESNRLFNWDELINGGYDNILVFEYDESLKKNEVIFLQTYNSHTDEEIEKIKNNEFTIYSNNDLLTLRIKTIEKSYHNGMKISKELYDELVKKQSLNVKIIKFNNYYTAEKMERDFYKRETNKDFYASREVMYSGDDPIDASNFIVLIDSCNTASIFLICVFIIIFAIVVKNSLIDQKDNIKMKRFLGYKKIKIKACLIENFVIMCLIAYFASYILSDILIIILDTILNYEAHIVDLLFLVKLAGVTTTLSVVLILLFDINQKKEEVM